MYNILNKLVLALTLNLLISVPVYAKTVEQKNLAFPIKPDELLKGDIHYFFEILSPQKLAVQYPDLFSLDSLSLNQEDNVMMVINKSVYVVNKPVGFFEDKQLTNERYISHILGQNVKKLGKDSFKISAGNDFSYQMHSFFDSDDISTLPNSKIISAVGVARKLDVISQSASTLMFTERTHYTKYTEGGVSASSFIPMKENKTLIITYNVWAVKKSEIQENSLEESFQEEVETLKKLQESFK